MGRKHGQAGGHERNRKQRKRWGRVRESRKTKPPKEPNKESVSNGTTSLV